MGTCRKYYCSIMPGKICILRVDIRLIFIPVGYPGFQTVRYQSCGYTIKIPKCILVCLYPVFFFLAFYHLHVCVLACSQYRDKCLLFLNFTCLPVNNTKFLTRKINKCLISRFMVDMHSHFTCILPDLKVVTELGVTVPFRMLSAVLFP